MAFTLSITQRGDEYLVSIVETGIDNDAFVTIDEDPTSGIGIPENGRVVRQDCRFVSGSGSTVDPVLSRVESATSAVPDIVCQNGDAAAAVSTQGVASYWATITTTAGGTLTHRSNVNDAAADHEVHTEYTIKLGAA